MATELDRWVTLGLLCVAGCGGGTGVDRDAIAPLIHDEILRHPALRPEDLYKLLHQAAMGSEHAMNDTAEARRWMTNELASLGAGAGERMIDTIAPGGAIVRINLRPWVAAHRSTDSLLTAFIRTARTVAPDTMRLSHYLAVADSLVAAGGLPFEAPAWRTLVEKERSAGFPAGDHSPEYEAAYHPAYRVVAGPLIP